MAKDRERLALDPVAGAAAPEPGRWLAAFEEVRRDTLKVLAEMCADDVDRDPGDGGDTLGTVLYHMALIEADWVFADVLGRADEPAMAALFPHDHRVEGGRLTPVRGESMAEHLERLAAVRLMVLGVLRSLSAEDFHRVHPRADYDVSADWVVFHLIDHEVEHRVRLSDLRDAFRA